MIKYINIRITISWQPNVIDFWYFKLWVMLGPKVKVWISMVYSIRLYRYRDLKIGFVIAAHAPFSKACLKENNMCQIDLMNSGSEAQSFASK